MLTYQTGKGDTCGAQLDLNAEDFFKALCEDMTERGTSSRELVALEFDPESGEISVLGGVAVLRQLDPGLRIANLGERVTLRRAEDRERLAEGLRKAGLPE